MKVLQVYKDVFPAVNGGIERYIHDLSSFCAEQGHNVEVVTAGGQGGFSRGFKVSPVPCSLRLLSNPIAPEYRRKIMTTDADVIHFHVPLPAAVTALLSIPDRARKPYIVTYHSDIVRQAFLLPLYGPLLKRFLKGAETVVATSETYRTTSRFLRELDNTRVIPIGVDTGRFSPCSRPSGDYWLFVGRFRSYKGIGVLLKAWELLPETFRLIMAGGGPMADSIRRTASRKNLSIQLMENVSDSQLIRLYRNAKALILPSIHRSEAYGMVQLEAMACGTPVISSNLATGVSWVNKSGTTGLSFRTGDPEALAASVKKLETLCEKTLRNAARTRAVDMFSAEKCFREVEDCLLKAAGN